MKKILLSLLCLGLLFGCSNKDTKNNTSGNEIEKKQPTNLMGTWVSKNNDGYYQEAVIKYGSIEINWINENEKSKSLYWAGTYKSPTSFVEEYSWTSDRNTEKMKSSLLASADETKDFKYKDDIISYEVSALGTTKILELKRK